MDCLENAILDVCHFHLGEYEFLLFDSLQIKYRRTLPLGDGLIYDDRILIKNLKNIYGCEFKPVFFKGQSKKRVITEGVMQYGRMIACIWSNYCPWQKTYKSSSGSLHFLVITDVTEKGIVCSDSLPRRDAELITWSDVEQGMRQIVVFDRKHERKKKLIKKSQVLAQIKKRYKPETIRKLIQGIRRDFDIYTELKFEKNIWNVPLYKLALRWYSMHIQFDIFLRASKEYFEWNDKVIKQNIAISRIFEEIRLYIVKLHSMYQEGELDRDDINLFQNSLIGKLSEVAEKEQELRSLIMQKEISDLASINITTNEVGELEVFCVPLVLSERSHMFSGRDYKTTMQLPFGTSITINGIDYPFPKAENPYDCMPMEGQEIAINRKIRKIVLMGYGTYGSQIERIRLVYGNYSESKIIFFSDWTQDALDSEYVIASGKFYPLEYGEMKHNGKIVMTEVVIEREQLCTKIVLPICNRIKVMAIWFFLNPCYHIGNMVKYFT